MSRIKILDISYYMMCPPKSGGALRIVAPLYKIPKDSGIEFDFLYVANDANDASRCKRYLERIPCVTNAEYVLWEKGFDSKRGIPKGVPEDVWRTLSDNLLGRMRLMLSSGEYDIVQIEHSFLAWLVPTVRLCSPRSRVILDAHNVEYRISELVNTYAPSVEAKRNYESLKAWEEKTWNWFDAAFTVSPVEEGLIRSCSNLKRLYLVPTGGGIDTSKYAPKHRFEKIYDILYIGTMNWFPNAHGLLWFIRDVWPRIVKKHPEARFHIIGSGAPFSELVELANREKNVEFLGYQADDVGFFHRSKVFVVPLWIGAGARVKIPTAWASGIPVVSTTFGAEGNGAVDGENIVLADDPESFADGVLKILDSPEYGEMLAENASRLVNEMYTVDYCGRKLVESYMDLVSSDILKGG